MRAGVFILLAIVVFPSAQARGATIKAEPMAGVQDAAFITVAGEFVPSDAEQFRSAVAMFPKAIVAFQSNGGSLVAAINIGTQIRLRNYSTLVPDNTLCASACATAWLGGAQRFMGRQAMIGFHAAYLSQDGHTVETGTGNALLGAYLNKLGLPDRAVVFITQSSPESMTWLSPETAAREGIDVSLLPPPENKPPGAPPQLATVAPPDTKSKEPKAAPPQAAFTHPIGLLPYLFDQIKKPAYRASLNAVIADRVDLPPWVLAFVQTGIGVATPGKVVQLASGSFELYSVCQPHNCWGNYLNVLYSPAGRKAWAIVSQDGYLIAVLGDATPEQRQALFAAAHQ